MPLTSETFAWKNILAGDFPLVSTQVTVLSGQNLVLGTVLGQITTGGKVVIVDSGNVDGSENPFAVLSEDVDASAADKVGAAFITGEFDSSKMVFGGTDTVATHLVAARNLSIFFKKTTDVAGVFGF